MGAGWRIRGSASGSMPHPVTGLQQKYVARITCEQPVQLASYRKPGVQDVVVARLTPHEEQRRAGAVLPPQDRVGPQPPHAEIRAGEREVGAPACIQVYCIPSAGRIEGEPVASESGEAICETRGSRR